MHIERTSYRTEKIYWKTAYDQVRSINRILAEGRVKQLIRVSDAMPDYTTTARCSEVYYEYFI